MKSSRFVSLAHCHPLSERELRWNHFAAFLCVLAAVAFTFRCGIGENRPLGWVAG
jgi:hypothetical protein